VTTSGPTVSPGPGSPLAYLFWHQPAAGEISAYETALAAFHAALAGDPPPGFERSWTVALAGTPWFGGSAPCYLDWYVVEDFTALGRLQDAAVDRARKVAHDAVAGRNGTGAGGLVAWGAGDPAPPATPTLSFVDKPKGLPYDEFRARLDGTVAGRGAWWMRQMTMGPGPEAVVVTVGPVATTPMPSQSIGPCRIIDGGRSPAADQKGAG
jgi:hypothetical protein